MLQDFISGISDFSILIPLIVVIISGIKHANRVDKLIFLFIALTTIKNIVTFLMAEWKIFNIYIYNWHNLISISLTALIFYHLLTKSYAKILAILTIIISIIIPFFDYNSLLNIETQNFNAFSYNLSGSLSIVLALLFFYELLQGLQVPNLIKYPYFWFSAGALLYYSGTIFSYIFIHHTLNNLSNRGDYWMIEAVLAISFNIFLSLSVWYMKPTSQSTP